MSISPAGPLGEPRPRVVAAGLPYAACRAIGDALSAHGIPWTVARRDADEHPSTWQLEAGPADRERPIWYVSTGERDAELAGRIARDVLAPP